MSKHMIDHNGGGLGTVIFIIALAAAAWYFAGKYFGWV